MSAIAKINELGEKIKAAQDAANATAVQFNTLKQKLDAEQAVIGELADQFNALVDEYQNR